MPRLAILCAFVPLVACAAPPRPVASPHPDPEMARVIAIAADQVRRCYRAPPGQRGGRGIVTILRVSYAPDGTLAELPVVLAQRGATADNIAAARNLAEAASLAVIRCVPLHLPAERYRGGWDSFDLTFSPKAVA